MVPYEYAGDYLAATAGATATAAREAERDHERRVVAMVAREAAARRRATARAGHGWPNTESEAWGPWVARYSRELLLRDIATEPGDRG